MTENIMKANEKGFRWALHLAMENFVKWHSNNDMECLICEWHTTAESYPWAMEAHFKSHIEKDEVPTVVLGER